MHAEQARLYVDRRPTRAPQAFVHAFWPFQQLRDSAFRFGTAPLFDGTLQPFPVPPRTVLFELLGDANELFLRVGSLHGATSS
jgi:hypothetical protein